jgi:4-aminobutyrate--pyruvate transaminase
MGQSTYRDRDIAFHFHPATNLRRHEAIGPLVIDRGKGIYVYDQEGTEYIEGLAGLWSVAVGFGEERITSAAAAQMQKLPYYHSFGHKSHPAAIDLAEKLVQLTPPSLKKVFFANSGSEANDTAIKMIWYANNAKGQPQRKKIISRKFAYHGITIASGSLTGTPWNHRGFDLPLPGFLHVSCPSLHKFGQPDEDEDQFSTRLADELEQTILREGPETVAAFIGEPIMAAGGVFIPPAGYWTKIQKVLREYGVLLIADEVITGFGRTGKMFGCEAFDIVPDMLVLSKQLTSSYMPLSALLVSDEIYQSVAGAGESLGAFAHGFTGSAHPVATAVALENLKIIEERDLVGNAARLSPQFLDRLHSFGNHPLVGEARGYGLIGAVELVADKHGKTPFAPPGRVGQYLSDRCLAQGLIVRAIGDAIAFCPPLIIEPKQVEDMFDRFAQALDDTTRWVRSGQS